MTQNTILFLSPQVFTLIYVLERFKHQIAGHFKLRLKLFDAFILIALILGVIYFIKCTNGSAVVSAVVHFFSRHSEHGMLTTHLSRLHVGIKPYLSGYLNLQALFLLYARNLLSQKRPAAPILNKLRRLEAGLVALAMGVGALHLLS